MVERSLYWIPRIITILAIIFMMMFSLDSIGEPGSVGRKLLGLLIQNIPVLILIAVLVVAWKREIIGGIIFIAAFIGMAVFFRSFSGNPGSLIVIIPFLLNGILFILHHVMYGKKSGESN